MKRLATLLAALLVAPLASAQTPTQTISADITSNTTWSSNEVYLLDGLIFVRPGATLTIEAGTVIKGKEVPSAATGDLASGLVVMVNADIEANGEADNPIIFTAEADNVAIAVHASAAYWDMKKINKAAAGDTASLLFQTGWSGRAEPSALGFSRTKSVRHPGDLTLQSDWIGCRCGGALVVLGANWMNIRAETRSVQNTN